MTEARWFHSPAVQPDSALWDADQTVVFQRLAAGYEKSGEGGKDKVPSAHSDSRE